MPNNIVKIKCPQCGAVLSVMDVPGLQSKNVTCPICKYKGLFTSYRSYVARQGGDNTNYGGSGNTQYDSGGGHTKTYSAVLRLPDGNAKELREGRNVIGRASSESSADIQLNTNGQKRMSREHLVITIKNVPGKGTTGYVQLYKEKVNKTYVNGSELFYGDMIVLNDGDIIELPDMKVKYQLLDDDRTQII